MTTKGDAVDATNSKKIMCGLCNAPPFSSASNRDAHKREQHDKIRVKCTYCHTTFSRKTTMRRHIAYQRCKSKPTAGEKRIAE